MIFNLMKPVPVQTATMYSYNGTVLPKLPEWDKEKYPYAVISRYGILSTDYVYRLRMFSEPYTTSGTQYAASFYNLSSEDVGKKHLTCTCQYNDPSAWGDVKEYTFEAKENLGYPYMLVGKPIWSNYDLVAVNGELWNSASDSVPPQMKGSLYNGVWFPFLPDWDRETYPYAILHGAVTADDSTIGYRATFHVSSVPFHLTGNLVTSLYPEADGNSIAFKWDIMEGDTWDSTWSRWEEGDVALTADSTVSFNALWVRKWTNFDLYNTTTGNLAMAKSVPVPVYDFTPPI